MASPGQEHRLSLNADISVVEDRWEVICSGSLERADVVALIDKLSDRIATQPDVRKCLVDIREARVTLGIMGEYVIGEHAAKRLAGIRIALIHLTGQVNKLLEDTAHNRGLRILMVDSLSVAREWLDK